MCKKTNKKEKNRNFNESLGACTSEMSGAIFFRFGMYSHLPGRNFIRKIGFSWIGDLEATCIGVKM